MFKKLLLIIKQKLTDSSFLSDSLSLSFSNLIASALNYLFLVCAAFFLPVEDFGVLGAGVGILTLLTMVGNIIQLKTTHRIAHVQDSQSARKLAISNLKSILIICLAPLALFSFFSHSLASLIHSNSISIILLSISAITLLTSCVANGYTAGLQHLKLQAKLGIFSALAKFIFGIVLILLGGGSASAIAAYAVGYVIIVFGSLNKKHLVFSPKASATANSSADEIIKTKDNSFGLIFVYCLLVSPFVFDQLLIQHFSPSLGGAYAALGILGKLVFFLSAPILSVVYAHACGQKSELKQTLIFKQGLLGLCIIIICILFGWSIFGEFLGQYIIPPQYKDILPQVFLFCLGISAYCITYLLTLLALVRGQYSVSFALLPAVIVQFILFSLWHTSIEQTVKNQIIVYSIQLFGIISFLILKKLRKKYTK